MYGGGCEDGGEYGGSSPIGGGGGERLRRGRRGGSSLRACVGEYEEGPLIFVGGRGGARLG